MTADTQSGLFSGETPMARRHREHRWETTSLGRPATWEGPLKTLVPIMLASNQPMFLVWGAGRTLLYNDAYSEILGNKHPGALGADFLEVWHEIRSDLEPIVEAAYRGLPTQMDDIQLRMQRRGFFEETHFSFFYAPLRGEMGEVKGFLCACTETTRQVIAERRLAESEARHRGVLANMDEAFTLFDRDFNILEVNDAACRQVGLPRQALIGQNHWERFPGTFDSALVRMYRQVLVDGRPGYLEHQYQLADGRKCWFEARAFAVGFGVAVLFRDVTERRALYEQVALGAERTRLAMDVAQLGTWEWDLPSGAISADERCRLICGLALGPPHFTLPQLRQRIHPDDWERTEKALQAALEPSQNPMYSEELRWVHPDGRVVWVVSRGLTLFEGEGPERRPVRMIGTVLDITERYQMIKALKQADRRKDEFLAMLAHELRNPLAPIRTAAHVLRLSGGQQQVNAASEVIERQVGHLTRLVDDLLDVSRVTRGLVSLQREPIDMQRVVSAALEQTRALVQARSHQLRTVSQAGPFIVHGDFHRLVQVVSNLLSNAAKYTGPGGTIELNLGTAGGNVQLEVRDNGAGIPEELLPHVFELFTQGERTPDRSQGGLGIGLALVRTMVELHGGEVRAESHGAGQGSTFTVLLPRHHDLPATGHRRKDVKPAPGDRKQVLIVDDNLDAAEMLAAALRLAGHSVTVTADAQGALRLAVDGPRWQVFILDIGLPDMTGYELAETLRRVEGNEESLFIALTGYGQEQDRQRAREAGFRHHVVKPADSQELLRLIQG